MMMVSCKHDDGELQLRALQAVGRAVQHLVSMQPLVTGKCDGPVRADTGHMNRPWCLMSYNHQLLLPLLLHCCQALDPSSDIRPLLVPCGGLLLAAFLPPLLRTVGFVSIGTVMVVVFRHVVDLPLVAQCLLYVSGAVAFVR